MAKTKKTTDASAKTHDDHHAKRLAGASWQHRAAVQAQLKADAAAEAPAPRTAE